MRAAIALFAAGALLACGEAAAPPVLGNGEHPAIGGAAGETGRAGANAKDASPAETGAGGSDAGNVPMDPCSALATCCPNAEQQSGPSCLEIVQEGNATACRLAVAGACGWCVGPAGTCQGAISF